MKLNYKQRIFFYFCLLLTLSAICIILFEHTQAKRYKTEALEDRLEVYANTLFKGIQQDSIPDPATINAIVKLFPRNLRVTLANSDGNVTYDNNFTLNQVADNHLQRPEIRIASKKGKGSHIRHSKTSDEAYLYFAKRYHGLYIRVALPYNIQTQEILKADNVFIYFILLVFIISLYSVYILAKRLTQSIEQLRDFATSSSYRFAQNIPHFPDDELGEVASQVVKNYQKLELSKAQTTLEKERLLQHIHTSEEGICFFTAQKQVEYYNSLFMQYLNLMLENKSINPEAILSDTTFTDIEEFLAHSPEINYHELAVRRQGRHFNIRVNRFEDASFEIIINDITKQEKTKQLKQEMTSNIAHELRTPITSIRGYLETIKEQDLEDDQKQYFVSKAYNQVINLSQLIEDMSIVTKIEEAPQTFLTEPCAIHTLIEKVKNDFANSLKTEEITLYNEIPSDCLVLGNPNLLYTIFRNLIENTLKYGGKKAHIHIAKYNEDEKYHYFSYADEGPGIADETHFNRLFERFYRISEGRTRKSGGTGLGLSIVKNAILLHQGTISAKNKKPKGLEFLFNLPKE